MMANNQIEKNSYNYQNKIFNDNSNYLKHNICDVCNTTLTISNCFITCPNCGMTYDPIYDSSISQQCTNAEEKLNIKINKELRSKKKSLSPEQFSFYNKINNKIQLLELWESTIPRPFRILNQYILYIYSRYKGIEGYFAEKMINNTKDVYNRIVSNKLNVLDKECLTSVKLVFAIFYSEYEHFFSSVKDFISSVNFVLGKKRKFKIIEFSELIKKVKSITKQKKITTKEQLENKLRNKILIEGTKLIEDIFQLKELNEKLLWSYDKDQIIKKKNELNQIFKKYVLNRLTYNQMNGSTKKNAIAILLFITLRKRNINNKEERNFYIKIRRKHFYEVSNILGPTINQYLKKFL